jgi:hypothetical protein
MNNETITTVPELAAKLYNEFTTKDRNGEEIVVLKDRTSEYGQMASDLVYRVHGGMTPSDSLYAMVVEVLGEISDQDATDACEMEFTPDVYTSDLMDYLREYKDRVEDAIREYGMDNLGSLDGAAQLAQEYHLQEIAAEVIDFLENNIEDDGTCADCDAVDEYGNIPDGDYIVTDTGYLGCKTAVVIQNGPCYSFDTEELAFHYIRENMESEGYYPNVWRVTDHGNQFIIDINN